MAGSFIVNWTAANEHLNDVWDILTGEGDLGSALSSFIAPLIGALFQMLQIAVYPIILLLNVVINQVNEFIFPIVTFFDNIYTVGSLFYDMVDVFTTVFPSEWTYLLGAIITINIALRIYSIIPLVGKG